jgi:hypothetical protein
MWGVGGGQIRAMLGCVFLGPCLLAAFYFTKEWVSLDQLSGQFYGVLSGSVVNIFIRMLCVLMWLLCVCVCVLVWLLCVCVCLCACMCAGVATCENI